MHDPTTSRRKVMKLALATSVALGGALTCAVTAIASPGIYQEVYQGRTIRIVPELSQVFIDDVRLHVMTDRGGYTSVVNHYQRFPGLPETARAAVRTLRGKRLQINAASQHKHQTSR
jgi:hypothetical protein